MVEGQKMSKSLGNYYTLRDILGRGYAPEAVRYLLASVPYRKTLNFTFDGLQSAKTAIERLRNFKLRLETGAFAEGLSAALADRTAAAQAQFAAAMDEDLNTAEALASMFEYVRDVNTSMDAGDMRAENRAPALEFLARFDSIFAVLQPAVESGQMSDAEVEAQIQARNDAKKARNFALSDGIRQELLEQGIILEDTKSGTRWKRKSS
jgi:cysteinyl-tRNA synthetase